MNSVIFNWGVHREIEKTLNGGYIALVHNQFDITVLIHFSLIYLSSSSKYLQRHHGPGVEAAKEGICQG